MASLIKAFLGGGSSYIYLAVILLGGGFYIHYKDVKGDLKASREQIEVLQKQNESRQAALQSQSNQADRKIVSLKDLEELENEIRNTSNSLACSQSEPIVLTLNRLRDKWELNYTSNNPD